MVGGARLIHQRERVQTHVQWTSEARAGGKFSPFVAVPESSLGDEVTIIAITRGRAR